MATSEVQIGTAPESATRGDEQLPASGVSHFIYDEAAEAEKAKPVEKKIPILPLAGALVVAFAVAGFVAVHFAGKTSAAPATFQDLGAGISNATGLKGDLQVRWQDTGQYQVKFEPIDPLQSAGFSFVAADPPAPISINMRILDATGFALCNKSISFPLNYNKPGAADVFQNSVSAEGKVVSFSAQGTLPCTAEQFRQASYWDFSTNFPSLSQQDALMKQGAADRARTAAEQKAAQRRIYARQSSAFTTEGDDRATGYDGGRYVLEGRLGRDFFVTRPGDRALASSWAAAGSLFHYKCDQHSHCGLTHAGGGETIYVMALQ